ncbi:MAG: hypothetical protein J0I06_01180 [Planctomycetes bacterium]|nr:hypothetical protein [Planctomycetota bacterium]
MPLSDTDWTDGARDPRAFLQGWAATVADALNGQLAADGRFVAEVECHTREAAGAVAPPGAHPAGAPTHTAPARFTDRFGVNVVDTDGARAVAAVVLFATPDNKSDSDAALAFAVRAAGFMSAGIGVVVVDALPGPPSWATHLHSLTGVYPIARRPRGGEAPVLVVHPAVTDGAGQFAVWHHGVVKGFPLPTVSVPVRGGPHPKLDLEATYLDACQRGRTAE